MPASMGDLPSGVLSHILIACAASEDLCSHLALCAQVCPDWRRTAMANGAYGTHLLYSQLPRILKQVTNAADQGKRRGQVLSLIHI